ncbi:hypothetical protein Sjap_025792 [Stephania japonica]|uniref:Uncharacterized protein n=1 Tax=Stephania japonica TaxID=461633 RepID=A0AAP0HIA5_9MAGN
MASFDLAHLQEALDSDDGPILHMDRSLYELGSAKLDNCLLKKIFGSSIGGRLDQEKWKKTRARPSFSTPPSFPLFCHRRLCLALPLLPLLRYAIVASAPLRHRRLCFATPSSPPLRHHRLCSAIVVSTLVRSTIFTSTPLRFAIICSTPLRSAIIASVPARAHRPCSTLLSSPFALCVALLRSTPVRSFSSHHRLLRPPIFSGRRGADAQTCTVVFDCSVVVVVKSMDWFDFQSCLGNEVVLQESYFAYLFGVVELGFYGDASVVDSGIIGRKLHHRDDRPSIRICIRACPSIRYLARRSCSNFDCRGHGGGRVQNLQQQPCPEDHIPLTPPDRGLAPIRPTPPSPIRPPAICSTPSGAPSRPAHDLG